MAKALTLSHATMTRILHEVGFEQEPAAGPQLVFHHQDQDAWIVLPPGRPEETVDAIHVAVVRRQLVERGLVESEEAFNTLAAVPMPRA
jgi:predicted RNA binding protein YcfA (HicA-like mRNA interferase family)